MTNCSQILEIYIQELFKTDKYLWKMNFLFQLQSLLKLYPIAQPQKRKISNLSSPKN